MSLPKCNKETCSNVPFLAVGIPKYTDCKDWGSALAPCYASASPALSLVATLSNKAAGPTHTLLKPARTGIRGVSAFLHLDFSLQVRHIISACQGSCNTFTAMVVCRNATERIGKIQAPPSRQGMFDISLHYIDCLLPFSEAYFAHLQRAIILKVPSTWLLRTWEAI